MKIKLHCLKINDNEIKTTEYKELGKFVRRNRKDIKEILCFSWEIPKNKLERTLEYSVEKLYELKKKGMLFDEEFKEYEVAEKNKDRVEMLDAVCDMYYIHIGTLLEKNKGDIEKIANKIFFSGDKETEYLFKLEVKNGFDVILPEAFEEVHKSNMSKLGKDGKPIFREDGKIIKGPNFFRPNLKQFITK